LFNQLLSGITPGLTGSPPVSPKKHLLDVRDFFYSQYAVPVTHRTVSKDWEELMK